MTIFCFYLLIFDIINIKFPKLLVFNEFNVIKTSSTDNNLNNGDDYFNLALTLEGKKEEFTLLSNELELKKKNLTEINNYILLLESEERTLKSDVNTYKGIFDSYVAVGETAVLLEDIYPIVRSILDLYILNVISTDFDSLEANL